ncbi:hypothetical protein OXX69_004701 [Metschnikowia pulcherrima]
MLDSFILKVVCFSVFPVIITISWKYSKNLRSIGLFVWACFLKPLLAFGHTKHGNQQEHLDQFYGSQAEIYDATRKVLLKGRKECLQLAAAHLDAGNQKLVWVDIGGGTGQNIEMMNEILDLEKHFQAIYLVDLSHSLCEMARERFIGASWGHLVTVIEADASEFTIAHANADLVTFSYSLSMIPSFHAVVDHAASILDKTSGIIACVDFGIQSSDTAVGRISTLGGLCQRNVPWLIRHFWRVWFEADRVFLGPARRNYLEYKFGTVKAWNAYNNTLGRIPFYVWIGCDKFRSRSLLHRINCLATESPYLAPSEDTMANEFGHVTTTPVSKGHEAAVANFRKKLPFPSVYYQKSPWRVYFDELNPAFAQFRNQYIYAFTWEDPREDHQILKFTSDDTVLAITSAGDNVLAYAALPEPPRKIHAVDLNPCQNHLLELKLAAMKGASHEQIWQMFGEGRIENFKHLLLMKLCSHMSSNAFQYWMDKAGAFEGKGLYDTGSTRWALRLAKAIFFVFGIGAEIDELCRCTNMKDQIRLWQEKIRPVLFNPIVAKILVGNPVFLWKALGVPANQAKMMGDSVLAYVVNTLDPVIQRSLISQDNYFYYLTLQGHYTRENCPSYLTEKAHKALTTKREDGTMAIDDIRIHTDTLNDVFARLANKSITIAIIMDHMDWFDPQKPDAEVEILAVKQCLAPGGRVMLRSAAQYPWYIKTFEKCGFRCKPAGIRHPVKSIDRTNMYASTWVCTKQEHYESGRHRMSSLKI